MQHPVKQRETLYFYREGVLYAIKKYFQIVTRFKQTLISVSSVYLYVTFNLRLYFHEEHCFSVILSVKSDSSIRHKFPLTLETPK
jgi:hypothetical protein